MMDTSVLVGEWKTVLLKSYASLFGIGATVFGGLAEFKDQLPALVDFIPKATYGWLSIACAIAVPLARIIKQQKLRDLTGAANPQPTTTVGNVDSDTTGA